MTQKEKAKLLLKLHHDDEVLVILNSWDPGSSRVVEACGFKAVGTTSMGLAASLGYHDCEGIPFDELIDAVKRITRMVNIPVTVDFEGGFGKDINQIVENTKMVIQTGAVGINIEDSVNLSPDLLDVNEFCARLKAIRELSDSMGIHLVINARTDVFLAQSGTPEERMAESIMRGNKYREAGADCIFVPGVWESEKISMLVKEIHAPVNILANPTNGTGLPPTIPELQKLGVARVSVGSSLTKASFTLIKKTGDELIQKGTYNVLSEALSPIDEVLQAYKMATGTT